jgi:hypothetical protein
MNGTRCAISPAMKATSRDRPVELGHDDRTLAGLAGCERCRELRSPVQGVGSLAGLDLGELGQQGVTLGRGEPRDGGALCLDAEAGPALPGRGYAVVGMACCIATRTLRFRTDSIPPFAVCT